MIIQFEEEDAPEQLGWEIFNSQYLPCLIGCHTQRSHSGEQRGMKVHHQTGQKEKQQKAQDIVSLLHKHTHIPSLISPLKSEKLTVLHYINVSRLAVEWQMNTVIVPLLFLIQTLEAFPQSYSFVHLQVWSTEKLIRSIYKDLLNGMTA